jgi:crotonobetaine/carnitine-CoA ligase
VRSGAQSVEKGFMGQTAPFHTATILDEDDEECAPGVPGQLCLRPRVPHLMLREYFNKAEATRKVFENQWFHTGDWAFRDESNTFFMVDRIGAFIRTGDENISSYQIEDIINGHPQVSVAAVFPIPAEEDGLDHVVSYIIPINGEAPDEGAFNDWIAKNLPPIMQPKYIRFVDDLPRTPTNKIEKYKLKAQILQELGAG